MLCPSRLPSYLIVPHGDFAVYLLSLSLSVFFFNIWFVCAQNICVWLLQEIYALRIFLQRGTFFLLRHVSLAISKRGSRWQAYYLVNSLSQIIQCSVYSLLTH